MKYRALFFVLILHACAYSQESFVKGYIVKQSNDTVRGYLKRDMDIRLAEGVYFKTEMFQRQDQLETSKDIVSFAFDNGNIYRVLTYSDPLHSGQSKTEFGKFLVEGEINLYAVARRETYLFYIKNVSDTGYLLYDDVYNNNGTINEQGNFRSILNFEARNCAKLQPRVSNMPYQQTDIIKFVSDLNQCLGSSTTQVRYKRVRNEAKFMLYAGGMSINHNSTFTFQGQVRLISPGVSKRTSIITGLYYSHVVTYDYSPTELANANYITDIISVPFLFQYNFTESKFQPLIYGGFSGAYKKETNPEFIDSKGVQTNFGLALVGGIGFEYYPIKRLAIKGEWRYELLVHTPTVGIAYKFN